MTHSQINVPFADDIAQETIDKLAQTAVTNGVAPAISLHVIHNEDVIFDGAWGYLAPLTEDQPVTPETLFDLASVTKLYTSVAFLSLVIHGAVSFDTPVADVLPAFADHNPRPISGGQDPHSKAAQAVDPAYDGQRVDMRTITCYHLLTHTAGLAPWRDVYKVAPAPTDPTQADKVSREMRWSSALDRLLHDAPVAPPGTGVRYSDNGLMILGEIVARLTYGSGKLDDALRSLVTSERLPHTCFRPLDAGYTRAQIAPTENDPTWRKRRVWGEVHDENACGCGGVTGHAGLFSTARDVAQFGKLWLHDSKSAFGIPQALVLKATELHEATGAEVRGLGWMLKSATNSSAGDLFSPSSYGHTGFTGTSLWIDPQRQLIVALLTNRVYHGRERVGIHQLRREIHDSIVKGLPDA